MKRFVTVPAKDLLAAIARWGNAVISHGGRFEELLAGGEVAFRFSSPRNPQIQVQLYTTLAKGGGQYARDCGEDAVRIVVGTVNKAGEWRNIVPPVKVLRTAPQLGGDEAKRVENFLRRLHKRVVEGYQVAKNATQRCPLCGSHMALRTGGFYGCIAFPRCRGTRNINGGFTRPILNRASAKAAREMRAHFEDVAIKHHGCLPEDVDRDGLDRLVDLGDPFDDDMVDDVTDEMQGD